MVRKAIIKHNKIPVNALQYTGDNYNECCDFVGKKIGHISKELHLNIPENVLYFKCGDGGMFCYPDFYIIEYPKSYLKKKDEEDEFYPFYPCRKELFELCY